MECKKLSVFIDESGDFGKLNPRNPFYYVAMVLHNQSIGITNYIKALEVRIKNLGFDFPVLHAGPLIRREEVYKNDLMETRKALFNSLFSFYAKASNPLHMSKNQQV